MTSITDYSGLAIGTQAVPSLLQLSVELISNFKLWSSAQDIPEPAVPLLLKSIKNTDFKLDHLPNLLPASLQHLDLTGFHSMTEEVLLAIIKKCFLLRTLILKDMPLLNDTTVSKILWYLPELHRLSLGAGVGSLSILETQQRPNILTHLEIHSASLDDMWLEHLRYFPHLTSLKLRNATVPRLQSIAFKLPPNLSFVDITISGQTGDGNVNLLSFFLTEAPNLVHLALGGDRFLTTKEVGPIVANKLRALHGRGAVKVSQAVADAISDTCQRLEEVSGFSLYISGTESRPLGVVSVPAGMFPVSFTYTTKKLNHNFSAITSETAWTEGPTEFKAPNNSSYVLPIDPCPTLRRLELEGGTVDIVEMLQLFPNLEALVLKSVKLKIEKLPARATNVLGSKLKSLNIQCNEVPEGAIEWLSKSSSLKCVTLNIDQIPEFKSQPILLDSVLRRFPFVKYLTVRHSSISIVITNERTAANIGTAVSDHPLKELRFIGSTAFALNGRGIQMQLEKFDFNHYKHLQLLSFSNLRIGTNVILPNQLRGLSVDALDKESKSFNIPETLYHFRWETQRFGEQVLQTLPKLKNLCSVELNTFLKYRAAEFLKDSTRQQAYSRMKYLVPPRPEEPFKTNYLSVFTGIKDEALLVSTLKAMLGSSGSNLSIEELQLIAEMYSKHEINLRSEEPTVNVKIRLASGTVLNIICNPSHRVLDLYAYARHAVKLYNKAFDLVTPFRKVLDLSTYDKTVRELDLAHMTLIQSLRDYTPVENELRNFGLANVKLMGVGKNKHAGVTNYGCYSIHTPSAVDSTDNSESQDDDVSMSESSCVDDDNSDDENSSENSEDADSEEEDDDDYYGMQVSDDEEDWMSMFPEPKKEVDPGKYLLDQMNAAMMRKSIEYHEQKEREEREEARLKYEAEQKKKQEEEENERKLISFERWQRHAGNTGPRTNHFQVFSHFNYQNIGQPMDLNDFATDEELALAMQQDEFEQIPYM